MSNATAADGLRGKLFRALHDEFHGCWHLDQPSNLAASVLALPALRDVLAAAEAHREALALSGSMPELRRVTAEEHDRLLAAAEKWRRVEAVLSAIPTGVVASAYLLGDLRRALDVP